MKCFFEKRDPWGHGMAFWVIALFAFAAPLTLWALRGIRLNNDVQDWLPEDDREARIFNWMQKHFPDEDRVIVAWEGSTLDDPRVYHFAEALRGAVGDDGVRRGGVPYVHAVFTPQDAIKKMTDYNISEEEAIRRLNGVLIGTGWLKVRLSDSGREETSRSIRDLVTYLNQELDITVQQHPSADAALESLDFDAYDDDAYSSVELEIPKHDFQLSWEGIQPNDDVSRQIEQLLLNYRAFATSSSPEGRQLVESCFFAPGSPVAVSVTLSEAGAAEPHKALAAIREAALTAGVPEEDLHIGGRAVTSSSLNAGVRQTTWNPDASPFQIHKRSTLLLSAIVGIALAFYFLKSFRLGILVVGTSWYATAISIALIPLTGTTMNMVLVVMPTLLMVLSLSAAIHVANYWKHAAYECGATAVSRAVKLAWQPCLMASLTTAVGLASLCSSSLRPVKDFGIYSAIGCIVMLGVVLLGLPSLLQVWPTRRPTRKEIDAQAWKSFAILINRHWGVISLACISIGVLGIYGIKWFRTETKVIRYFPDDSRIVRDYLFLEENLSGITPVDIVIRFDKQMQERTKFLERMEIIRAVTEEIRQHPEISGAISLADFQPVHEIPEPGSNRREMFNYFRRSQGVERAIKNDEAQKSSSLFVVAQTREPALSQLEAPLNEAGDELWRISAQASVMSDINYSDLTGELHTRIRSVTRLHPGASHIVTGTVPLFLRTQEAVLESLIVSFALAFGLIACVMIWVLKDIPAGLLSMIPNLLPVGFVFGLLSWNGQRIDIGTMITASVALGIAVDGTLHLLTWFRDALEQGKSRFRAVVEALAHCGPAMWQTSAAVGIGLLMLAPADLLLISRFGWLMASLIGAALVADIVLLPALLSGWLGMLIQRRITVRAPESPCEEQPMRQSVLPAPHIPMKHAIKKTRSAG